MPVKYTKDGIKLGDDFITEKQTSILSRHVKDMLTRAVKEISEGNIECAPYFKSDKENACTYCDYKTVCAFDTDLDDLPRFTRKMKSEEVWESLGNKEEYNGNK